MTAMGWDEDDMKEWDRMADPANRREHRPMSFTERESRLRSKWRLVQPQDGGAGTTSIRDHPNYNYICANRPDDETVMAWYYDEQESKGVLKNWFDDQSENEDDDTRPCNPSSSSSWTVSTMAFCLECFQVFLGQVARLRGWSVVGLSFLFVFCACVRVYFFCLFVAF